MDRVRLGRALGYGARHAARTLAQAVDAASAPGPAGTARPAGETTPRPAERVVPVTERVASITEGVARARANMGQSRVQAGRFGRSVWSPLAHFSSVLWLQVTGSFFAVIAVFLAQGAWKQRGAWRLWGSHEANNFYVLAAACALFAYLTVSNFVRAARRERK